MISTGALHAARTYLLLGVVALATAACDSRGKARSTPSAPSSSERADASSDAPLDPPDEEYLTLSRGYFEVRAPPPDWARKRLGDWLVFESPDKMAIFACRGIRHSKGPVERLWIADDEKLLGISSVTWDDKTYRNREVGPDHLPGSEENGRCKLGSRDCSVFYVNVGYPPPDERTYRGSPTAWPDIERQALGVGVIADDAPEGTRRRANAMADSIRRKW
jgi:hypothetical protein